MYSKTKIIVAVVIAVILIVLACVMTDREIKKEERSVRVIECVDIRGNSGNPGTVATKRCDIMLNRFSGILMTDEEYELLAGVIYDLAGGKSEREQRRVCEIVFNRVLSDEYPNTVEKVIKDMDPCRQFDNAQVSGTDCQRNVIDYVMRAEPLTDEGYYFY